PSSTRAARSSPRARRPAIPPVRRRRTRGTRDPTWSPPSAARWPLTPHCLAVYAAWSTRRERRSRVRGLIPAQHAQRPERVPPARPAVPVLQLEMDLRPVRVLERPAPVVPASLSHELDGLGAPRVGGRAGRSEVLERSEHVVVPLRRKREQLPGRIDD